MTIREQKAIFGFVVAFMLVANVGIILTCPPPLDGERPLFFTLGCLTSIVPGLAVLAFLRRFSR